MSKRSLFLLLLMSLGIGLLLGKVGLFGLIGIGIFLGLGAIVSGAFLFGSAIAEKRSLIQYSAAFLAAFTLTGITMLASYGASITQKEKLAEQVLMDLDTYKSLHSLYPETLKEANISAPGFQYVPDGVGLYFSLQYSPDGWHIRTYSSFEQRWEVSD